MEVFLSPKGLPKPLFYNILLNRKSFRRNSGESHNTIPTTGVSMLSAARRKASFSKELNDLSEHFARWAEAQGLLAEGDQVSLTLNLFSCGHRTMTIASPEPVFDRILTAQDWNQILALPWEATQLRAKAGQKVAQMQSSQGLRAGLTCAERDAISRVLKDQCVPYLLVRVKAPPFPLDWQYTIRGLRGR